MDDLAVNADVAVIIGLHFFQALEFRGQVQGIADRKTEMY